MANAQRRRLPLEGALLSAAWLASSDRSDLISLNIALTRCNLPCFRRHLSGSDHRITLDVNGRAYILYTESRREIYFRGVEHDAVTRLSETSTAADKHIAQPLPMYPLPNLRVGRRAERRTFEFIWIWIALLYCCSFFLLYLSFCLTFFLRSFHSSRIASRREYGNTNRNKLKKNTEFRNEFRLKSVFCYLLPGGTLINAISLSILTFLCISVLLSFFHKLFNLPFHRDFLERKKNEI